MEQHLQQEATNPSTSPERLKWLAKEHPDLLPVVASNPAAPSEWLAGLYRHQNKEVRAQVARNPNTPAQTLLLVGAEFPEALLANPAFALAFLENPDLFRQVQNYLLAALAPFPGLPLPLMQKAAFGHESVRKQVAKNPALTEELAFLLAGDERFEIRRDVLPHSALTEERRLLLRRLGITPEHQSPQATDKGLTEDELSRCCESGGFAQWITAGHPNITAAQLERLWATTQSTLALVGIARSPRASEALLQQIYEKHKNNEQILVGLLENPSLPRQLVNTLAARTNSPHAYKIVLAARPELSEEQLESFSKSGRISIRASVAKNPSTPPRLLSALCADKSSVVRAVVALHPRLYPEDISLLSQDRSNSVRYQLMKRERLSREVLLALNKTRSIRELSALAKRPDTPPEILSSLLFGDEKVFILALANPNTPKDLADLVRRVRGKVLLCEGEISTLHQYGTSAQALFAEHPQVTPEQLEAMCETKELLLCSAAARSPKASPELLRALLEKNIHYETSMLAAKRLVSLGEELELAQESIQHLPEWLQERLRRRLDKKQLKETAKAPSTSRDELEAIAKKDERELLRIIATRQDLPVEALEWFRGRFIRKLLDNEGFVARLKEQPEAFYRLPLRALLGVVSQPKLPEVFLRWAATHSSLEVRHSAAKNPRLSAELLVLLSQSKDEGYTLRRAVAQHPAAPRELLAIFLQSHDPWLKIWAERRLVERKF